MSSPTCGCVIPFSDSFGFIHQTALELRFLQAQDELVTDTDNRVFDLAQRARRSDSGPNGARFEGIERLHQAGLWDQVIDEIDGRRIRIGTQWYTDFASCNYLGFDLEPAVADAIDVAVRQWGSHPSWSRMLGSPRLYTTIE